MRKKEITIIISITVVIMGAIGILRINNTSRMDSLNIKNNQENSEEFKTMYELETKQNFNQDNNESNDKLERSDNQGEVTVKTLFLNPTQQDEDYLKFEVYLNTHSVELDKYDLGELTTISIGNKIKIVEGIEWKSIGAGHHMSGLIKVPREYKGKKINYAEAEFIELEIKDLAEVSSRKFKWEKEEL